MEQSSLANIIYGFENFKMKSDANAAVNLSEYEILKIIIEYYTFNPFCSCNWSSVVCSKANHDALLTIRTQDMSVIIWHKYIAIL